MPLDYKVVNVEERLMPMIGGGFGRLLLVHYTTSKGYSGTIEIAKDDASPDKVKKAILADVGAIHSLYNIQGNMP